MWMMRHPELTVAVVPEYRGKGVGTRLFLICSRRSSLLVPVFECLSRQSGVAALQSDGVRNRWNLGTSLVMKRRSQLPRS